MFQTHAHKITDSAGESAFSPSATSTLLHETEMGELVQYWNSVNRNIGAYNGGNKYIGDSCGSFPQGLNCTTLVQKYYFPFSKNAGYIQQMQPM